MSAGPAVPEGGTRAQQRRAEREAVERRAVDEWRAHEQRAVEAQRVQAREQELQHAQRAAEQQAAEQRAQEQRAAEERAAEQQAAEQRAQEQAEQRVAQQALAAQRRAAEQLRAEQEFAAQRRAAEERHAQQQRLAEERLATERYEEERRASERRYAEQQRAAAQRHPDPPEPEPAIDDFAALLAGVAQEVDASHHFLAVPDAVVEESARRDRRRTAESKARAKGKRGSRQKSREAGTVDEIPTPAAAPGPELEITAFAATDRAPRAPRRAAPTASGAASASRPSSRPPAGRSSLRRAIATRTVSLVAMGFVAMLAVATSVPSLSLLSPQDVQAMALSNTNGGETSVDGQQVDISGAALAAPVGREAYQAQTIEEYAAAAGIRVERTFTNNPLGTVQWPFAVGVHIGDRFGYRNCAGCSANHGGQDFNPGLGAQIQSIADGVVSNSTDSGGSLGVVIMIDHIINGEPITSVYAHMEYGSRRFEVGDTVSVGDVIGTTGDTGMSTGPHLHFEIRIGGISGTKVDPLVWLYENTN